MLARIKRGINTQCITAYCIWGCNWSVCPCSPHFKGTYNGHMSIRTGYHKWMKEGGLFRWIIFSLTLCGWSDTCALLTVPGEDGTRMHTFMLMVSPNGSGHSHQAALQKLLRINLQIPQIIIWLNMCGMRRKSKFDTWRPQLAT